MPELADLAELDTLERLATGFSFTEGPIWHPAQYLLFSDIPQDTRRRWDPERGITVAMSPANKCNGMTLTRGLSLLVCEHSTSSVVVEHPSGRREVLASHWGDRELNAPNDIVTGRDDSIYFSDPVYGRMPVDGIERDQDLDFQGLYRISRSGDLQLLAENPWRCSTLGRCTSRALASPPISLPRRNGTPGPRRRAIHKPVTR